jgi:serine phosphatase RsbU (regulator of sigma subunit)
MNRKLESFLLEALRQINSDLRLETAIKNVLAVLAGHFDAEAATVILLDLRDYSVRCYSSTADSLGETKSIPFKCNEEIIGWNASSREPILANNLDRESAYKETMKSCLAIDPRNLISVPLSADGEFFGLIQVINNKRKNGFAKSDLMLLTLLGQHVAVALRNSWILEEAVRGSAEARSLYGVGIALSASLDLDELLEKILDNLHRVVQCDTSVIYLVNQNDGTIYQILSRGVSESQKENLHMKMGQGVTGRVVQTGEGIIVPDVSANPDYIAFRQETRSEMAVPLKVGDAVIGAINLESDKPAAYGDHDLNLLNAFASLAAIAIERARLYNERMTARRLEDELSIARRIQITFLPSQDPVMAGFDVSGVNIPSAAVGGDYYDFIPIVDNQLGVAIGDVSGKGIPAALIMAAFRASLKAEIRNNFAIRAILLKVNDLLFESLERDNYVTAIYGVLDTKNRVFTFSNAGHNPPILLRANGQVEYLKEGGLALGTFANSTYEERPIHLDAGDTMLFYTDGVTEVQNASGKELGVDRLLKCLQESKNKSARDIIEYVVNQAKNFASGQGDSDDLTMVVIKAL